MGNGGLFTWGFLLIVAGVLGVSYKTELVSEFSGSARTLEIEVSSLRPHRLCGVRPGERKFTIKWRAFVRMGADDYEVTSHVRVNGSVSDENFTVGSDGCVQVSFAFDSSVLGRQLTINGEPVTVSGVMPRGFEIMGLPVDAYTPFRFSPRMNTGGRSLVAMGRL